MALEAERGLCLFHAMEDPLLNPLRQRCTLNAKPNQQLLLEITRTTLIRLPAT